MTVEEELKRGWVEMPSGFGLHWREEEYVGRVYYSDEVGGGIHVWTPAMVAAGTLAMAIAVEEGLRLQAAREKSREVGGTDE